MDVFCDVLYICIVSETNKFYNKTSFVFIDTKQFLAITNSMTVPEAVRPHDTTVRLVA